MSLNPLADLLSDPDQRLRIVDGTQTMFDIKLSEADAIHRVFGAS